MSEFFPPLTRRVLYAVAALVIGIATNAWHKNVVSQLLFQVSALALSVWLGMELGKKDSPK